MKKIGIILFAMILGTTISFAQPGGQMDPEAMAKRQTEELKEVLSLDKAQEKQVYDLNIETGKTRMKMFEKMRDSGEGFEGMREKMTKMREEDNKKMKKILTEAQMEKYLKWQEEMLAKRRERMQQR